MGDERFDRLSEGQKECLRLFHARWEIKDIARQIGRSPVTVNQRLAGARRHIGVDRSADAARRFAEYEAGLYTPPIYAPIPVAEPSVEAAVFPSLQDEDRPTGFPLPFPTQGRPYNDMTFTGKLAYSLVLAAIIALIFGGAAAALSGLSDVL